LFRSNNVGTRSYVLHTQLADARYMTMRDWIEKKLSEEWTVHYLNGDTETYLFEHKCGGAVAYTDDSKVCSQCKTPVPGKLIMVIQMVLKRDLIRV